MLDVIDHQAVAGDVAAEGGEEGAVHGGRDDELGRRQQLFGSDALDRALHFYMAVLDERPDHMLSLLRVGQIRSWTNDPRGAIPFYERRLAATDDERGDECKARRHHPCERPTSDAYPNRPTPGRPAMQAH